VRSRPLVNESALRLPERREELRARRRVYRRVTQIPREGSFLFPAVATRVLLLTYAAVSVGDEKPLACASTRRKGACARPPLRPRTADDLASTRPHMP